MTLKNFLGRSLQFILVLFAVIIMLSARFEFFIISFVFYAFGGIFEFIIMNKFYGDKKEKLSYKDKTIKKIKNGFLWVHKNLKFIKKYNSTIYDFNKIGILTCVSSYAIMLMYIIIARLLFNSISYYAFLIYLIPTITNIYYFHKYKYHISN
ncbi:MAG: hypothetical protein ABIG37_03725 [Nanoarchaeota archaeon]|nr:hypothetical protein [Nanoarchaeota archaeon]